jgi:seryl-tRNA synthetase
MSTENTAVEAVEVELTPAEIAENFIKEHSFGDLVDEFVNHYNAIESLKRLVEHKDNSANAYRMELRKVTDTVEEFLKEHIKENDSASVEELKELAAELDIELTKTISVSFTVQVEAELTVPLDFDEEDINDGDFDISVDYCGRHDDVDCDDITSEVDDFSAEEN